MTDLSPAVEAAWNRGTARALADLAALTVPTTVAVTLDAGRGERRYISWCLSCQYPASRCRCATPAPRDTDVEDLGDALTGIADVIAATRADLNQWADIADAIGADA